MRITYLRRKLITRNFKRRMEGCDGEARAHERSKNLVTLEP